VDTRLNFLKLVREAANKKILFLPHAVRQMSRLERMISTVEVQQVIKKGKNHEMYVL